jgi:hypothetical protein
MRRMLIVLTVLTTMVVGTQVASAAVTTHLSIRWNATTERFHGKVSASDAECIAGRTVKVFKKTANGPVLQGKTKSTSTGSWHVTVMHAGGNYFAHTRAYDAMGTKCTKARSDVVHVM